MILKGRYFVLCTAILFGFTSLFADAKCRKKGKRKAVQKVTRPALIPLQNAAASEFQDFIRKCKSLIKGGEGPVRVFILGDSHMQCEDFGNGLRDYFTDSLRIPYAGRSFAFPYPLARTSHRSEMLFGPTANWRGTRFTKEGIKSDWGLAGFTAHWDGDSTTFDWRTSNGSFRKGDDILIFSPERCAHAFRLSMIDTSGNKQSLFYNHQKRGFEGSIAMDCKRISFDLKRSEPGNLDFVHQGFLLFPKRNGLVCGISGTNGARLDHYLQSPEFQRHLATLNPDLMVVCLGTNDAFTPDFNPAFVRGFLEMLLAKIKSAAPGTAVLLVGPPDHKNGKKVNPRTSAINSLFAETADQLDFTFWNQQRAMGGPGSIFHWYRQHLATRDMVHFTTSGYRLQARLLGRSIKAAF